MFPLSAHKNLNYRERKPIDFVSRLQSNYFGICNVIRLETLGWSELYGVSVRNSLYCTVYRSNFHEYLLKNWQKPFQSPIVWLNHHAFTKPVFEVIFRFRFIHSVWFKLVFWNKCNLEMRRQENWHSISTNTRPDIFALKQTYIRGCFCSVGRYRAMQNLDNKWACHRRNLYNQKRFG